MYKIVFYVPESHLTLVKQAVFSTGAGAYGPYDCCAWEVKGQGQFRPQAGSHPFIGQTGQLERLEEYRVELLCDDHLLPAAIEALKRAHPYEAPGYEAWPVSLCGCP
jgi:hypothetical protein